MREEALGLDENDDEDPIHVHLIDASDGRVLHRWGGHEYQELVSNTLYDTSSNLIIRPRFSRAFDATALERSLQVNRHRSFTKVHTGEEACLSPNGNVLVDFTTWYREGISIGGRIKATGSCENAYITSASQKVRPILLRLGT